MIHSLKMTRRMMMKLYHFNLIKKRIFISLGLFIFLLIPFLSACSSRKQFVSFEERTGIIRDYEQLEHGEAIDWFYMGKDAVESDSAVYIPDFVFIGNDDYELYDDDLIRIDLKRVTGDYISDELKGTGIFSSIDRQTGLYPPDTKYILSGAIICLDGCQTQFFVDSSLSEKPKFSIEVEIIDSNDRNTVISAKHTIKLKNSKHEVILAGLKAGINKIVREMAIQLKP